jgi:16S rRNA (guanine966-N2)-methyltransferase
MRIITGLAKGRRLVGPDTRDTRPATDRVREAVFSMLADRVVGAVVLDLYAGSGSFGLEALSRGAAAVTFVEKGRRALEALRRNISAVDLGGTVVTSDVDEFLARSRGGFDLVFIDPPWDLASETLATQLESLAPLLRPGAEVILSRRHSDPVPTPPKDWRVAADRRYGDTRIVRYDEDSDHP